MAINFDSPDEIQKRLQKKKAAEAAARRGPKLRPAGDGIKFQRKIGAAPKPPGIGGPAAGAPPKPTAAPAGRVSRAVKALKAPVTLRGAAKTAGKVLKKIPGVAGVAAAIETPIAAGGALRQQAERSVPEIQKRGGFIPSVVQDFGDTLTGGRATAVGGEISKAMAGMPTNFSGAFLRGEGTRQQQVAPTAPSAPAAPTTVPPTQPGQPGQPALPGQTPRLRSQMNVLQTRTPEEQQAVDRGVAGIESQTQAVRSQRAAQLGIPIEALPFIDAGGRVEDVEKALRKNLEADLGPKEGALTGKEAADIKLRQQRLGFDISKAKGAAGVAAEGASRERTEFAQGQIDRLHQGLPEEERGAANAQFEETWAGADFRTPQDFQQAKQLQDVLEQARVAAEEATGLVSSGGFLEGIDKFFGWNDPKVGPLSAKEAASQIRSFVGDNEAFGELLNESKTELSPKTMKLLAIMRKNAAKGQKLRDY